MNLMNYKHLIDVVSENCIDFVTLKYIDYSIQYLLYASLYIFLTSS